MGEMTRNGEELSEGGRNRRERIEEAAINRE